MAADPDLRHQSNKLVFPLAEAMMTIARRSRIGDPV
jgi:hypothetical protein